MFIVQNTYDQWDSILLPNKYTIIALFSSKSFHIGEPLRAELLRFGVLPDTKRKSQDHNGNEKLQDFDEEVIILVHVAGSLLGIHISTLYWDGWSINLPDMVLLHHLPCRIAVANIFKISSSIFPWFQLRAGIGFQYEDSRVEGWNYEVQGKYGSPVTASKTSSPPGCSSIKGVTS